METTEPPPAAEVKTIATHSSAVRRGSFVDPAEVDLYYLSGMEYLEGLARAPPVWESGMAFLHAYHNMGGVAL